MFDLQVLGSLDLRERETDRPARSVLAQPKRVALLCALAMAPRGSVMRRDRLLAMFWPELPESRARKALNQSVYVLRRALGRDAILTRGDDEVGLDGTRVACDAATFLRLVEESRHQEAMDTYGGELLPGFFVPDCTGFERWLEGERRRVREAAAEAAWSLAEGSLEEGQRLEAIRWAREAAAFDPLSQSQAERLMRVLAAAGDASQAIEAFQDFEERLEAELEMRPGAELRRLAERLVAESGEVEPETDGVPGEDRPRRSEDGADAPEPPARPVPDHAPPPPPRTPEPVGAGASRRWSLAVLVLALAGLAAVVAGSIASTDGHDAPLLRNRVLVAPLANQTGNLELDGLGLVVADRLTRRVGELAFVEDVVPPRMAARSHLDGGTIREIANQAGAGIVLSGHYFGSGDTVDVSVEIRDGNTAELLRPPVGMKVPMHAPEESVEALGQRIAGSLATVLDPRLESWAGQVGQPPSLAAYRDWVEGIEIWLTRRGDGLGAVERREEAIDRFLRAAGPDSAFAQPLLWAADVRLERYDWDGFHAEAAALVRALEPRRGGLTPMERALLDGLSARVSFQHVPALKAYEEALSMAPMPVYQIRAGEAAVRANRPVRALALFETLPTSPWVEESLNWRLRLQRAYHAVGRFDDEMATLVPGSGGTDSTHVFFRYNNARTRAEILAARGDTGVFHALEEWRDVRRAWGNEVVLDHYLAREAWSHGHRALARELADRALESHPEPSTGGDRGPLARRLHAEALAVAGRFGEAASLYRTLVQERPDNPYFRRGLGFVAGRLGDVATAREMEDWLAGVDPEPFRTRPWVPVVGRAAVAAGLGEADRALDLLREALRLGLEADQLHADHHFFPLADHPEFREIVRPKG